MGCPKPVSVNFATGLTNVRYEDPFTATNLVATFPPLSNPGLLAMYAPGMRMTDNDMIAPAAGHFGEDRPGRLLLQGRGNLTLASVSELTSPKEGHPTWGRLAFCDP